MVGHTLHVPFSISQSDRIVCHALMLAIILCVSVSCQFNRSITGIRLCVPELAVRLQL